MKLYGTFVHKEYVKDYEYGNRYSTGPTCSSLDTYKLRTIHQAYTEDYPEEHRVRPSPVVLYPTGRAKKYTSQWRAKIFRPKSWVYPSTYCKRRGPYNYIMTPTQNLAYLATEPELPSWENKIRLAIKDHGQVSLGETAFEFRETASMFHQAGMAVKNAWQAYRAKRRVLKQVLASDIAAAELTASFGINPLLGVLKDSYDVLNERLVEPIYTKHTAAAFGKELSTFIEPGDKAGEVEFSWSRSRRAVFYVQYQYGEPKFTMGNPLEIAWELTPFSWLVDGLIDIGGYLSALDYLGDKYVSCKGTMTERDKMAHVSHSLPATWYEIVVPGTGVYKSTRRYAYYDIPDVVLPRYSPSRSWHKIMHAVSALTLIHSGGVRRNRAFVL